MPWLDHFGLVAPLYDRIIRPPDTTRLAELAGLPARGRLLDVGGGTGRIARALADKVAHVVVADESWRMLAHAPTSPPLLRSAAHAERMPFPAGVFEHVIMVDAFHHLKDQERSLGELVRVCAPGGRIVIEEPDIERVAVWGIAILERLALFRSRFRRAGEIAGMLRGLGTEVSVHRQDSTVWVVAVRADGNEKVTSSR